MSPRTEEEDYATLMRQADSKISRTKLVKGFVGEEDDSVYADAYGDLDRAIAEFVRIRDEAAEKWIEARKGGPAYDGGPAGSA